ncbi:MAG: AAA family ATPase, partial [bacterium]|nr:AAA family ATPase [bacterium]
LATDTWSGLKVISLEAGSVLDSQPLRLLIRNEGFVADVGAMGHGLQMWLQTMWFLARTKNESTIILDEPDVYLHADLQRKLIRLLINQKRQVIVTTHSVEIMAEVDPENILIIDKKRSSSKFAASLPAVQRIIGFVGSSHNIHLARMWNSKRCLLVEGKDVSILKNLQNTLFPDSAEPFDTIPNMPIGGWGGWNYALGSSMLIENSVGKNIGVYCVLDCDFHTGEEIARRYEQASEKSVLLHIWSQKEIENYVLNPTALTRFIENRVAKRTAPPTLEEVVNTLDRIAEGLKDDLFDSLSHEFLVNERAKGVHSANKRAREHVKERWISLEGKLGLVSGKEVLTQFSSWSQGEFSVQVNSQALSRTLLPHEIHKEMRMVVTAIENSEKFEKTW